MRGTSAVVAIVALVTLMACGRGREHKAEQTKAAGSAASIPSDSRPVIVAFGDSLTAGLGVDAGLSYPAVLERQLAAKGRHYRVVNAGVSGDTTGGGVARLETVMAYKPKIVIVEFGANDGLRGLPVESSQANLGQIITTLQGAGAKVVLAGMTLPPNYGPEYIGAFERMFVELARKYDTPRIPFLLEDVATRPERMQRDGLHPNAAGHKVMAATVMQVLEPLL